MSEKSGITLCGRCGKTVPALRAVGIGRGQYCMSCGVVVLEDLVAAEATLAELTARQDDLRGQRNTLTETSENLLRQRRQVEETIQHTDQQIDEVDTQLDCVAHRLAECKQKLASLDSPSAARA